MMIVDAPPSWILGERTSDRGIALYGMGATAWRFWVIHRLGDHSFNRGWGSINESLQLWPCPYSLAIQLRPTFECKVSGRKKGLGVEIERGRMGHLPGMVWRRP
ncbi:hypothetical protein OIU85_011475 [Salix viminalis]|uniref:Uncharacterized protein n=1 Tax=Salix viminalis TaxID=40686 RepID=A0A9Q0SFN3_SALVM|nr:hypothetical protein OIU85_011475 [Salix viminalis]